MKITITDCSQTRLQVSTVLKPFNCTDIDLNNFLYEDARLYNSQLLAVTYLWEYGNDTVAYYSLFNDIVSFESQNKSERNRINRNIPNAKRRKQYPAVKIGRLAVSQEYVNNGIGSIILDMLKFRFVHNNYTGCRFITVDAYQTALAFYEKNGFKYLTSKDKDESTRSMYFDLKWFTEE